MGRHRQRTIMHGALLAGAAAVALCAGAIGANEADLRVEVERALAVPVTLDSAGAVSRTAILADGDVAGLLEHLAALRADEAAGAERRRAATELEAHVHWRRGDLDAALALVSGLVEGHPDDGGLVLWRARLLDGNGRIAAARKAYDRALELLPDEESQRFIRVRLALMELVGDDETGQDALAEYARGEDDAAFGNRAAIVLAVIGRPQDAIELFEPSGEGTARFRHESRLAEWALRAGDAGAAQTHADAAVTHAELGRDRRYALSLLLAAHRLDDSLDTLLERFASSSELTPDEEEFWIDLLRERERFDEAIGLFSDSAAGRFSIEMRRELLTMQREAGRDREMIETYRRLIETEPDELVWRRELTRVHLERGERAAAEALWPAYVAGLSSGAALLEAARAEADLGLDDLAREAVERAVALGEQTGSALLFLSALHRDRGRLVEAEAALERLDEVAAPDDAVRFELAESFERLGRQRRAVEILEGIRAARGEVAEDLEMRLAWLLSEIGEEETALVRWRELWSAVNSVPRRRYVEDRLMSVASRLGTLADLAIELEEKLADGSADERDVGLLVRLYTKVGDAVSATEILQTHMTQTGGTEVELLQEKARVYLLCNDHYHYEKCINRLMEVDPEGKGDYLRQLAMSQLERGKPAEAREVLLRLKSIEVDSIGAEFEAGVLAIAGLREEAADAYRRGIAVYPDRIEAYLLLANLLRDLGERSRAVGMFQFLAETADQDDLFTIAIDGLLNMEADSATLEWARRITLERLAGRHDRNYLFQLLVDLAEQVNDREGQLAALESSIAISGSRRASVLRELMDLAKVDSGRVVWVNRGGTMVPRPAPVDPEQNRRFLDYGRRLVGLDEAVPPQVFLDLGKAFLDAKAPRDAARTFGRARNLPDERAYRREVASIFETAGRRREALRLYERLLRASPSRVSLIVKVAELHEQEGEDAIANGFYRQGIDLLLQQTPLTTAKQEDEAPEETRFWFRAGNVDDFDTYYERLLRGFLVTLPDETDVDAMLADVEATLGQELELVAAGADETSWRSLAATPRISRRSSFLRRLAIAFDRIEVADRADGRLLARYAGDEDLLPRLARTRIDWGFFGSVRNLLDASERPEAQQRAVLVLLGDAPDERSSAPLPVGEVARRILPHLVAGRRDEARELLRRSDLSSLSAAPASPRGTVMFMVNGVIVGGDTGGSIGRLLDAARLLEDQDLALRLARGWMQGSIARGNVYEATNVLGQCIAVLDETRTRAFCQFVADHVLETPERAGQFLALLPELRKHTGEALVDRERLLEFLEEAPTTADVGFLGPVLRMLPPEDRAVAARSLLTRVPANRRLFPLPQLIFGFEEPFGPALGEYLVAAWKETLAKTREQNAMMLQSVGYTIWSAGESFRTPENLPFVLQVLEVTEPELTGEHQQVMRALRPLLRLRVDPDDTEARADAITLVAEGTLESNDYYVRQARDGILDLLLPERLDEILAAVSEALADEEDDATGGAAAPPAPATAVVPAMRLAPAASTVAAPAVALTPAASPASAADADAGDHDRTLTDRRLEIVRRANDPERMRAELNAAIAAHPDFDGYLEERQRFERRRGEVVAALATDEAILARVLSGDADDESSEAVRRQILLDAIFAWSAGQGAPTTRDEFDAAMAASSLADLEEMVETFGIAVAADEDEAPEDDPHEAWRTDLVERIAERPLDEEPFDRDPERLATLPDDELRALAASIGVPETLASDRELAVRRRIASALAQLDQPVRELEHRMILEYHDGLAHRRALREAEELAAAEEEEAAASIDGEDTIDVVKTALEAEEPGRARTVLRRLWRNFPPETDAMNRFWMPPPQFAGLTWPNEESAEDEADAAEDPEEQAERRRARRGGLATFTPPEDEEPESTTNAWKVLADHDFGVREMQRILRSRTANELQAMKPVMLGQLAARRAAEGDDAVLAQLLAAVRAGRAGRVRLLQLLTMLDEDPKRITPETRDVLDDLVRTIEPTDTALLSRVARLYGSSGARDEAARLYEWCATRASVEVNRWWWDPFATEQQVTLRAMIDDVKTFYEGDALIEVIERMLRAHPGEGDAIAILAAEVWEELLGPQEALVRVRSYLADLDDYEKGIRRETAKLGAALFARAGELDDADRALTAALRTIRREDMPEAIRWRYWGENVGSLNTKDLFRLFPESPDDWPGYVDWLRVARDRMLTLLQADDLPWGNAVRPLVIVALRLHEAGASADARALLAELDRHPELHSTQVLLALDVARRVGDDERAAALERQLFDAGALPAVRFAELVERRGAAGPDEVAELGASLTAWSLDPVLLERLAELAPSDHWSALTTEATRARAELDLIAEARKARAKERETG